MAVGRDEARARLEMASDRFVALLAGLGDGAWTRRPAAGGWSAAEHAEHVLLTNRLVHRVLSRGLRPLGPETPRTADDAIPALLARELAPDERRALAAADPTGELRDRTAALALLREMAAALLGAIDERPADDFRAVGAPHPILGPLDGVQWALFAVAHTEQHHRDVEAARLAGAGIVS